MFEISDWEEPMNEDFLEEMGLETFIKGLSGSGDLEELKQVFRANRGIYAEDLCTDCKGEMQVY